MPVSDGEWRRAMLAGGIRRARDSVVPICCSRERLMSSHLARAEASRALSSLMAPIPALDVVVADGGRET